MKAVYSLTLLVIFSLASYSHSQATYNYSFYNNGTCTPVQSGQCIPCTYYTGSPVYYFQIIEDTFGDIYAMSFYDSICSEEYSYVFYSEGRCDSENAFENCLFFGQISSLSTLSLTLTSTEPVVVSLLGEGDVYTQISSNKVSAQGERLAGVQIHSGGKNFFVEQQVSDTQYSSNIGVFTLGKTYTHTPFTFTVTASEIDFPLPPLQSDITVVSFSPFFSAQVTDDSTYSTYHEYSGEIDVYVDGSYTLDGLVLTNPFYSINNMTFYPPFQNNNHGDLVFQLEASSSPFLTVQCYLYGSSLNNGYTFDNFECEMGSLSGIISGSFLSFSLDEFGEQKIRQPDEMAFSLF